MDEISNRRRFGSLFSIIRGRWPSLFVLTCVYVVGELSHFLLGIVTRPMSQELEYGIKECLTNQNLVSHGTDVDCYNAKNQSSCETMGSIPGSNDTMCTWNYSGLGLDYQILAGPAFVAVFTISGIFLGMAGDRFNRRNIVAICLTLLTVATGLTGFATAYWQLVVLRMSIGAGESAFSPVCSSMVSDYFPPARRGLALGIFNWGIYFGYGLSYAIGNFVTKADIAGEGWRMSYFISAVLGIFVIALTLLIVSEPRRKRNPNQHLEEKVDDNYLECEERKSSDVTVTPANDRSLPDTELKPGDIKESLWESLIVGESGLKQVLLAFLDPPIALLTIAACARHTAGFTWAYNTQLYFTTYYPSYNLGIWITPVSIVGGTLGVATGGFVSDKLVKKIGIKARIYVLAASQLIATPFAAGVLYFSPPAAFYILLFSYTFAEMWLGVLFAVLLELIPSKIHSTSVAFLLFIINNVGGNAPVLVEPLRNALSYRLALLIMYPGLYFVSSILFFLSSLLIREPAHSQKTT